MQDFFREKMHRAQDASLTAYAMGDGSARGWLERVAGQGSTSNKKSAGLRERCGSCFTTADGREKPKRKMFFVLVSRCRTRILAAKRPDLGDELGNISAGIVRCAQLWYILQRHVALKSSVREDLPDALQIDWGAVIEAVHDVRVGRVGNASCDLCISILGRCWNEMRDVESDSGIGRSDALHHLQACI